MKNEDDSIQHCYAIINPASLQNIQLFSTIISIMMSLQNQPACDKSYHFPQPMQLSVIKMGCLQSGLLFSWSLTALCFQVTMKFSWGWWGSWWTVPCSSLYKIKLVGNKGGKAVLPAMQAKVRIFSSQPNLRSAFSNQTKFPVSATSNMWCNDEDTHGKQRQTGYWASRDVTLSACSHCCWQQPDFCRVRQLEAVNRATIERAVYLDN